MSIINIISSCVCFIGVCVAVWDRNIPAMCGWVMATYWAVAFTITTSGK